LGARALAQVLRPIQQSFSSSAFPDLLVGLEGADDAAVWRVDAGRAIVVTTDFFTPVVDDPYDYGAIAAANSLSDIYAMGATPFLALNIAAFPEDLPLEVAAEIVRGGAEKALEANVPIVGGHTVKDKEPSTAVALGWVDPQKMMKRRSRAETLVITKCLVSVRQQPQASARQEVVEVTSWMKQLNRAAAALAAQSDVQGATDVTGFGLLGHATEMARAAGLAIVFDFPKIPFLAHARAYAEAGIFPAGAVENRDYFEESVVFDESLDVPSRMLLFDPQTSGGLLLAVPEMELAAFHRRASESQVAVWPIGRVEHGAGIRVLGA
jgi:selenide,water dikinase